MAIAKRHQEEDMPGLFDADGDEVYEDELEAGDLVYDEDGTEFVVTLGDEDDTTSGLYDDESEDEYAEGELVGKAAPGWLRRSKGAPDYIGGPGRASQRRNPADSRMGTARAKAIEVSAKTRSKAGTVRGEARHLRRRGEEAGRRAGQRGRQADIQYRGAAREAPYRTGAALLTVGGAGGAGATYAGQRRRGVHKSLGESVYEELSKALGQDDRDQVISKMANEVEIYKSQAEEAMMLAEELAYERELEAYTEIAKGYNLPVDPARLGEILKNAADTLPEEDLADLDRLLMAQSDLYAELGTNGSMATSNVMDNVNAMALQAVGKADMSESEAVVALFAANPDAYDEYLTEQRG